MASQRSQQSQRSAPSKVKSNTSAGATTKTDGAAGYPAGHFGHLTAQEEDAFQKFKVFLQDKGDYRPGPPPSHDDPTLL
jgi:hypothetical protein